METIGVDLGNCNIKTSKGIIVPSLITRGENYLISTGYQLEFNNEILIIGEGDYDTNLDKISKENSYYKSADADGCWYSKCIWYYYFSYSGKII